MVTIENLCSGRRMLSKMKAVMHELHVRTRIEYPCVKGVRRKAPAASPYHHEHANKQTNNTNCQLRRQCQLCQSVAPHISWWRPRVRLCAAHDVRQRSVLMIALSCADGNATVPALTALHSQRSRQRSNAPKRWHSLHVTTRLPLLRAWGASASSARCGGSWVVHEGKYIHRKSVPIMAYVSVVLVDEL